MWKPIWRFLKQEDGPTSVEYCVMLMLIILAAITGIQMVGQWTGDSFQNSSAQINSAMGE